MTRRNPLARREPSGKVQRVPPDLMSPTEVRRMVDAAKAGLRDPVWSSQVGMLKARGLLTDRQFAAARCWLELLAEYAQATQSPKQPRSANLDPKGGTAPDPDSATGRKEARRDRKTVDAYQTARKVLAAIGEAPKVAVRDVVELDLYPVGALQLHALRGALSALATLWGVRK